MLKQQEEQGVVDFTVCRGTHNGNTETFVRFASQVAIKASHFLPPALLGHVKLRLSKSGGFLYYKFSLVDAEGEAVAEDLPPDGHNLIYMSGGPGRAVGGAGKEIVKKIIKEVEDLFAEKLAQLRQRFEDELTYYQAEREEWGLLPAAAT